MDTERLTKDCRAAVRVMDDESKASQTDYVYAAACANYLEGVLDAFETIREWGTAVRSDVLCVPNDVKRDQVVRVFTKYADAHPEVLNRSATSTIWSAMHFAFPCPAK